MARTTLLKTALNLRYPALPIVALSAHLNFQACSGSSGSNGNQILWGDSGSLLLVAYNSGVGARTVTITSKVDPYNRTGDITAYALAAGALAIPIAGAWILDRQGFYQSDGYLYLEGNHAEVLFACVGI
jgi:hypothetical protein